MGLLDPSRDLSRPTLAGAEIEGYVVDVDDPEKRQRVRVRLPVMHRDIPDDKIPWSNKRGNGLSNAGAGVGSVDVPDKFAKVMVRFLTDDPHDPQYGPSPTSDEVHKDNELLKEDYPNTFGNTDSYGNRWSTNKATGDVNFTHKSGSTMSYDGGGNVSVAAAADMNFAAKGNITIAAQGNLNLSSKAVVNVAGDSSIELNTSGSTTPNVPGERSSPQIPDRSNQTSL